jgi:hypothetical protein
MSASIFQLPRTAQPFVRFIVGADFDRADRSSGLFRSAFRPDVENEEIPTWLRDELRDSFDWFSEHLPVPPFRGRQFPRTAICWFRSDAGPSLARMWELVALLSMINVPIRFIRTDRPGRLLYFDDHQIVADQRWRRRP